MKNIIWLLSLIIVGLAGCSREPMIHIDSSVQASLDAKNKPSSDTTSVESSTPTTALVDMSNFSLLPEGSILSLNDYALIYPNQLKVYSDGQQTYELYMNFINEQGNVSQISEKLAPYTVNTKLLAYENGALIQKSEQASVAPLPNILETAVQPSTAQRILLQEPIAVGTTWTNYDATQSTITALYEQGTLHQVVYNNIVEVSTTFETYTLKEFYAAQEGLILTWIVPTGEDIREQQWQLVENYRDVKWSDNITLAVPNTSETPILAVEQALLSAQTNESLAQAFTTLFREKGWLNDQVSIQQVGVDSANIATIDFTPGIIASLNAQAAKEEKLLPAIVQTIANYYQVQQVRMTVNGLILTPDRLPTPTDGIWQVDSQWLGQ